MSMTLTCEANPGNPGLLTHYEITDWQHQQHFGGYWYAAWIGLPFGFRWRGGSWMFVMPLLMFFAACFLHRRAKESLSITTLYVFAAWLGYAITALLMHFTQFAVVSGCK